MFMLSMTSLWLDDVETSLNIGCRRDVADGVKASREEVVKNAKQYCGSSTPKTTTSGDFEMNRRFILFIMWLG